MEKPKFRNISLRDIVYKQIEDFIETHPEFVAENPECKSAAGFVSKAALAMLRKLKCNSEPLENCKQEA